MNVRSLLLLSGPLAVGKTAVRDQLVLTYGFSYLRSSQYLRACADRAGRSNDRKSMQNLGDRLDAETDYRWLIDDVALPAILNNPAQALWLIDAVRKARQIEHFRSAFGRAIFHVHFTAPESVLMGRYESRQRAQGDLADPTPYEMAIDHENERSARALIALADVVLDLSHLSADEAAQAVIGALKKDVS
jgi:AAA domain